MPEFSRHTSHLGVLEELYTTPTSSTPVADVSLATKISQWFAHERSVERVVLPIVLFVGVGSIIVGMIGFHNRVSHLGEPIKVAPTAEIDKLLAASVEPTKDLAGLSKLDTDKDGLSDYDEQFVYSTSAYLDDSDSDGVSDKDELTKKTDPNCAFERNCVPQVTGLVTQTTPSAAVTGSLADRTAALAILQGTATTQQIRELLVKAGMSATEVSQLSEADVRLAYQQILAEAASNPDFGGVVSAPATTPNNAALGQFANLPPDQIRQLLIQGGMAAETVNQINDEALLDLVTQTLAEQSVAGTESSSN
jgi:hypothetical protein